MTGIREHYDLAVIGAGIAGMAAALFAAERGLSTLLAGCTSESFFTGGPVDLLGVFPAETSRTWSDPWEGIRALAREVPEHPLARVAEEDIRAALSRFFGFLGEGGLIYDWEPDANMELITAMGSVKTTYGAPRSMMSGVTALWEKAPCLVVGIQGLKGFSSRLVVERLKGRWPGLKAMTAVYVNDVPEVAPLPLAQGLEVPENRARLAEMIRPLAKDAEYVGIPAVMGLPGEPQIMESFSREVGRPVFEIPTMPPSLPGIRMKQALTRALAAKGVDGAFSELPVSAAPGEDGRFLVNLTPGGKDFTVRADALILASGRFVGGGLSATPAGIRETLLDLPVVQPGDRDAWHGIDFFDPRGHMVNRAGIATDERLRPVTLDGRPVFENLFAAGTILAHQDWMRTKCGTGLSVATAFHAVKSL